MVIFNTCRLNLVIRTYYKRDFTTPNVGNHIHRLRNGFHGVGTGVQDVQGIDQGPTDDNDDSRHCPGDGGTATPAHDALDCVQCVPGDRRAGSGAGARLQFGQDRDRRVAGPMQWLGNGLRVADQFVSEQQRTDRRSVADDR